MKLLKEVRVLDSNERVEKKSLPLAGCCCCCCATIKVGRD